MWKNEHLAKRTLLNCVPNVDRDFGSPVLRVAKGDLLEMKEIFGI
jgi:hypothetical protein